MTAGHADHELVRAVARLARQGEITLAVCLDCKRVLNVWRDGLAPAAGQAEVSR